MGDVTAWTASIVTGELGADYSQIELHPGDGGRVVGLADIGLASGEFGDHAILTVARHFGTIALELHLLEAEPGADSSWDAAVEFSVHTGESMCLTGWAGDRSIMVAVPPELDVRVRYVVLDGQVARDQGAQCDDAGPDRYLIQMWPAASALPRIVASTSPWSQYWTFGAPAIDLLEELADVPDPDRLVMIIDRALARHPDVAERLRAGDVRYRVGVIRYLQELFRVTYLTGRYDDVRDDSERIASLIDERARLRTD